MMTLHNYACPDWCISSDHPRAGITDEPQFTPVHVAAPGWRTETAGPHPAWVTVAGFELEPARVRLDDHEMTADQASDLADSLMAAARLLSEIQS